MILFSNSASHFLCGEKSITIVPPVHNHVLIQIVYGKEGLFTDINVFERKREREQGKGGADQINSSYRFDPKQK